MIISHNILALNAARNFKINGIKNSKTTERLSSGYRINKSADDAAGLAISEKMRGQIRGLDKASKNIEDGISLIQTADGAMNEVHNILQRTRELLVQGFSDTNTFEDKLICQEEIDQNLMEIDRIGRTTEFNTIKILKGNDMIKRTEYDTTETVSVPYDVPDKVTTQVVNFNRSLPTWVTSRSDNKLIPSNPKISSSTLQDINHVLTTNNGVFDVWTPTLTDNDAGVINFEYLNTLSNPNDVVSALEELVDTGFYSNCRTCITKYALYFTTDDTDNSVFINQSFEQKNIAKVNLTDLIERAKNGESGSSIANALVSRMVEKGNKLEHFTRYIQDSTNPSRFILYDWRDNSFNVEVKDEFKGMVGTITWSVGMKRELPIVIAGSHGTRTYDVVTHHVEIKDKRPRIQLGANAGQELLLEIPNIGVEEMNLQGLSVFDRYTETIIHDDRKTITNTKTHTYTHYNGHMEKKCYPGGFNEFGEIIPPYCESYFVQDGPPKEITEVYQVEEKVGTYWEKHTVSALDKVDAAIQYVSKERARIGAQQNRLEHAYNYVRNASENLQASESRIRDADIASESMENAKSNILLQAANAMLVQANTLPKNALPLLQN